MKICTAILVFVLYGPVVAQSAPGAPERPWHAPIEQQIETEARNFHDARPAIDPAKTYSLLELIDLGESHNPETRLSWEQARAQAAALGIARSELFPTLVATALSQVSRAEHFVGNEFSRQTLGNFEALVSLNYTIFDFGARAGRIDFARAQLLASNFTFNDTHRKVIFQVEQAYYQLLNALGQEEAARASLANARTVAESADERLKNGLATLPDVLEARSASAQADYQLQATLGAEQIARGNLATAIDISVSTEMHVQPLIELPIPESTSDSVDQAIDRALAQRPDLLQQVAEIRTANAKVKEAHAAFYPSLNVSASPEAQALYGLQQPLPWIGTGDLAGGVTVSLSWTVFDGGARKNHLALAKADVRAAQAQISVARNQVADEVWTAYANLNTAFRQRQAATALLEAATQSYAAALESYNYGVRNLLDVTAAQQTLAQARSTDVLARTQVLTSLADLAYRTGDSIRPGAPKVHP